MLVTGRSIFVYGELPLGLVPKHRDIRPRPGFTPRHERKTVRVPVSLPRPGFTPQAQTS